MNRIAVFIAEYSVANSPSIINLLSFLQSRTSVDVFLMRVAHTDCPVLQGKNIRKIVVNQGTRPFVKLWCGFTRYRQYIAIDPYGFVLCKRLFPDARPFYYSLELYLSYDHFGLDYLDEVRELERSQIRDIKALIIQSKEKERLFRDDYSLPDTIPAFILPVTYYGTSDRTKSRFLSERFGLDEGARIAIHLGGTAEWYSCLELVKAFEKIPEWILFFQGYGSPAYVETMKTYIRQRSITNVIINDETYSDISVIDDILKSCTVGIAWYNDISAGFRNAGWSSGKISGYLRFGLPVITNSYPSMIEAVAATGSGLCIDTIDQVEGALHSISTDYECYSKNAASTYDMYFNFAQYEQNLDQLLLRER